MTEVFFNGEAGRIEGRYHKNPNPQAPIALILHPHPHYGGTMNNKVVYTLFSCFEKLGFSVLRFNFRGVGRTQGVFSEGEGEMADATSALDWLQANNPEAKQCWVVGYSYGAFVGLHLLMRRPDINNFIAVSPPADERDFSFLAPCPTNGLIVQGGRDDIVKSHNVAHLAKQLNQQKNIKINYVCIEDADHLYVGCLVDLFKICANYVLGAAKQKAPERKRRGRRRKMDLLAANQTAEPQEEQSEEFVEE